MTKEIIQSIIETSFNHKDKYSTYDGFIIKTNLQKIKVGIGNGQFCCENWGYLTSEDNDNFNSFIGAELLEVKVTDTALSTIVIENLKEVSNAETMFVTFETTNGTFQIVAYNDHNGYYGHDAVLITNSEDYSTCL